MSLVSLTFGRIKQKFRSKNEIICDLRCEKMIVHLRNGLHTLKSVFRKIKYFITDVITDIFLTVYQVVQVLSKEEVMTSVLFFIFL